MSNETTLNFNLQSAPVTLCIEKKNIFFCWFNVPKIKHQDAFHPHKSFNVEQKKCDCYILKVI